VRLKRPSVRVIAVLIVTVVVLGLAVWTLSSPPILQVQSQTNMISSIFSSSIAFSSYNSSDGTGSYTFKFGFDTPVNVTEGAHTRFAVYCALTKENITSPFTRGVGLSLEDATLSTDNRSVGSVTISSRVSSSLDTFYLENPDTNLALGFHNITARLLFYIIDVNYVGSFRSSLIIVLLKGNFTITS
jgi:hypothetical protein